MLAGHISTEQQPGQRGLAFGRTHRDAVQTTVSAYQRLFREIHSLSPDDVNALGRRVGEGLADGHPELLEEIDAIAKGAQTESESLLAVNARTEILAGGARPECSTIGVLPERSRGDMILAQNWDWHPDLTHSRVIWTIVEPDGRWCSTLTEAGILAKVGLNSRGIGLCLNILGSSDDGGVGGIPIHALLRLILRQCDDLASVRALLRSANVTASSCLTVGCAAAGQTDLEAFELSPAGLGVVRPDRGVLLHTNHFLDDSFELDDVYRRDSPDTVTRLDELEDRVRYGPDVIDVAFVKQALSSHDSGALGICCHGEGNSSHPEQQATLASVCLALEDRRMEVTDGAPCAAPYRAVQTPLGYGLPSDVVAVR